MYGLCPEGSTVVISLLAKWALISKSLGSGQSWTELDSLQGSQLVLPRSEVDSLAGNEGEHLLALPVYLRALRRLCQIN